MEKPHAYDQSCGRKAYCSPTSPSYICEPPLFSGVLPGRPVGAVRESATVAVTMHDVVRISPRTVSLHARVSIPPPTLPTRTNLTLPASSLPSLPSSSSSPPPPPFTRPPLPHRTPTPPSLTQTTPPPRSPSLLRAGPSSSASPPRSSPRSNTCRRSPSRGARASLVR
jgi:hypothetical protein